MIGGILSCGKLITDRKHFFFFFKSYIVLKHIHALLHSELSLIMKNKFEMSIHIYVYYFLAVITKQLSLSIIGI